MKNLDLFSIFFSATSYFILYLLWYSKFLFKKVYKYKSQEFLKNKKDIYFNSLIYVFILIEAYIIASFEILLNVSNFKDGITFGLLVFLAFILPCTLIYSYKNKIPSKIFILDNLLYLLGILGISSIIAG